MDIEYVSVEKSRAGYKPKVGTHGKSTPKTSASPAANTQPGGKSASKTAEEG